MKDDLIQGDILIIISPFVKCFFEKSGINPDRNYFIRIKISYHFFPFVPLKLYDETENLILSCLSLTFFGFTPKRELVKSDFRGFII